jgi:activating signal cointegrator complex subunit 3
MVDDTVKSLEESKCVRIVDDFNLETTFLGQIASFYYIKHQTANYFAKNLSPTMSLIELLKLLSYAKEFEEVPMRHNEDNYNEQLCKLCPYQPPDRNFDSANLKTFLLFQMYFGRLPPPIRDYVTDAKLVIDGSIRIIHALIDIASDKGYFQTVVNLIYIMQMIVQGLWVNDSQLKNIPHFTESMVRTLHFEEGVTYLCQL